MKEKPKELETLEKRVLALEEELKSLRRELEHLGDLFYQAFKLPRD